MQALAPLLRSERVGPASTAPVIPIARPWMDEAEMAATAGPISSGWLTQGPEVKAFESEFAAYTGASHACAVSSCTTALHLALVVAGVQQGDEVITVSHSYIATANSVRYCGATPVFIDIDAATYNMNMDLLAHAVSTRTKAIVCVHQMGLPCDLERVVAFGKQHRIAVIEDAACAIGSEIFYRGNWERIGRPHGDAACFSFHPRKVITTGDGGMITTSNSDWDRQFRLLRQHGMSISDNIRHTANQVTFEAYPIVGYNYRMTDLQAAIGRQQLRKLPEIVSRRRLLADRYREQLRAVCGITLPQDEAWTRTNWQSFCLRLHPGISQMRIMQSMLDRGIATRRGIMCAHRESAYGLGTWRRAGTLAASECAQDRGVLLPLYPQMTTEEQDRVIEALTRAMEEQANSGPTQLGHARAE